MSCVKLLAGFGRGRRLAANRVRAVLNALACRIECAGSVAGAASQIHLACNCPRVRHRTQVPELVGARSSRLNLSYLTVAQVPFTLAEARMISGSLMPTERDVVRLVHEGLGNKEIAARLFVSPRTVQTHLTHVYTKLGLTSRVQLVREAAPPHLGALSVEHDVVVGSHVFPQPAAGGGTSYRSRLRPTTTRNRRENRRTPLGALDAKSPSQRSPEGQNSGNRRGWSPQVGPTMWN